MGEVGLIEAGAGGRRARRSGREPCRASGRGLLAALFALLAGAAPAAAADTLLEGQVGDASGRSVAGVVVALYPADGSSPLLTNTGDAGRFSFKLSPGRYSVVLSLPGYRELVTPELVLAAGETRSLQLTLELARDSQVTVEAAPPDPLGPHGPEDARFATGQLELLRLPTDRFQETLPLLPGVVRDRRGRLSFNGARPSQSLLLVNGSSATDPLTGEFAVELPLKAIETVNVYTMPYSAQYGRVSGAVAEVVTRPGGDRWKLDLGGLLPRLRFRDGGLNGINTATPRLLLSGPLKPGRAWLSQGLTYRYVRSRAYDLAGPLDEEILESFDSFTQLTLKASERHSLTTTFALFPVEIDRLGLDTLHPAAVAPEFESLGWNLALAHRAAPSRDAVFQTTLALKHYDVDVGRDVSAGSRLEVEGLRGGYFNRLARDSRSVELSSSYTRFLRQAWGSHLLKLGADFSQLQFRGSDRSGPIEVVDAAGRVRRRIESEGDGALEASDVVASGWVNDEWRPTPRFGLTLGLRWDYDRIADERSLSPRGSFAWSLTPGGGTIVKGGFGLFYDRVPLHAASFEQFQRRVESFFDATGGPERRLAFGNRLAERGLRVPRSRMWNLELDQELAGMFLRVNYRERLASREPIVERVESGPGGPALLLSSSGRSTTRELDVTLRRSFGEGQELLLSWSKLRTTGDLNDFNSLYGNLRDPLLLESQRSLLPHDVPSRVLLWGVVRLPWELDLAPAFEWRRGFPYTLFEEDWTPAGGRNRGGRFPAFLSIDLRLTRRLELFGRGTRVGFQIYNLTDHFNPRDIQLNRASPRFGALSNSVGFSLGLTLQAEF